MISRQKLRCSIVIFLLMLIVVPLQPVIADGCAQFDVPSVVEGCDVTTEAFAAAHPNQRLIEIVIPCSTLVRCKDPQNVSELMIQIRNLVPGMRVVDYHPRTQTYSEIDGPVAVELHRERTGSIGLDATGTFNDMVGVTGGAKTGSKDGKIERFQRLPQQKLLLASGTINRGSGVYYKFLHSGQTTLEGGHQLALTLQVPDRWRGGLLRIDFRATGVEKYWIGSNDDFVAGHKSLMVATYLKGDWEAQQLAENYSNIERVLRRYAQHWQQNQQQRTQHNPVAQLGNLFGYKNEKLPSGWTDRFMLYDTRSIQSKIRPHLSKPLQRTTDQFVSARHQLLQLSR